MALLETQKAGCMAWAYRHLELPGGLFQAALRTVILGCVRAVVAHCMNFSRAQAVAEQTAATPSWRARPLTYWFCKGSGGMNTGIPT